ncbi:MAG TPA: ThiF family adenylyltransferase [Roseiflexaceae bacterium]|nr:ThiF family adenylyltransferase [Roseiflexaceae bacterium]
MQVLSRLEIEPDVPFIVRPGPVTIALVGCGGTGSRIALDLARLAAHLRASRQELRILFIDGDTVEERNVGRQLFTPADIGRNKAQALAARYNHLFGLGIEAYPEMATVDRLVALGGKRQRQVQRTRNDRREQDLSILIGAVDTATARRSLHGALRQTYGEPGAQQHGWGLPQGTWDRRRCWDVWIDSGNHERAGQVCVGTETDPEQLTDAILGDICTRLPAPSLANPDLLVATERRRREDCAAAMEDNAQSLEVNQMMAAIVASYLNALIIKRQILTFETWVDLEALSMRSTPIRASTIHAAQERARRSAAILAEQAA